MPQILIREHSVEPRKSYWHDRNTKGWEKSDIKYCLLYSWFRVLSLLRTSNLIASYYFFRFSILHFCMIYPILSTLQHKIYNSLFLIIFPPLSSNLKDCFWYFLALNVLFPNFQCIESAFCRLMSRFSII